MNDLMKELAARKVERRRQLAALPVGEKLRRLEEMVAATRVISATRPVKPVSPVRLRRPGEGSARLRTCYCAGPTNRAGPTIPPIPAVRQQHAD